MASQRLVFLPWGDAHRVTDGEFDHILAPLESEIDNILSGCGDVMAVDGKDLVSSPNATVLESRAMRKLHRETSPQAIGMCNLVEAHSYVINEQQSCFRATYVAII